MPEPAGSPAAQPVAPTQAAQDNHESLLIPTGIILPDGPEHAKASDAIDGSQKLLVGDAGAAEAGERDRTEERRRQKKDRKGKRARKEGVPLSDGANSVHAAAGADRRCADEPPIPTEPSPALPVVPEDNEHNDAHASDQQPLLGTHTALRSNADNYGAQYCTTLCIVRTQHSHVYVAYSALTV